MLEKKKMDLSGYCTELFNYDKTTSKPTNSSPAPISCFKLCSKYIFYLSYLIKSEKNIF